ncbi:MAG: hypothetical protein LBR38_08910 [Synergistaceae bacterium]|nr:hypothetical protein [Synergistaceae bacterium]
MIFVALSFLFFRGAGDHGLLDPVEGVSASVALNMAARGDLFHPMVGGDRYLGKALGFWQLAAGAIRVLGWSEFAVRFWAVVGAIAAVAATWSIARQLDGPDAHARAARTRADLAAVIAGTSLLLYVSSQIAAPYALQALCSAVALACLTGRQPGTGGKPGTGRKPGTDGQPAFGAASGGRAVLFHLCAFAGLLFQGPMGVVLPWLALLTHALLSDRPRVFFRTLLHPLGLLASLAVYASYAALLYVENQALLSTMRYNPPGAAFSSFAAALSFALFGLFPWTALLPDAIMNTRYPLLLTWAAVFTVFGLFSRDAFSLCAAVPAEAVLCAASLTDVTRRRAGRRSLVPAFSLSILGLAVAAVCFWRSASASLVIWALLCAAFFLVGRRGAVRVSKASEPRTRRRRLRMLALRLSFISLAALLPLSSEFNVLAERHSVRGAGLSLRQEARTGDTVIQYGINKPSLFFYTGVEDRQTVGLPGVWGWKAADDGDVLRAWEGPGRAFLVFEKSFRAMPKLPAYRIYEDDSVIVLSNRPSE